jgi:hypothetical protein
MGDGCRASGRTDEADNRCARPNCYLPRESCGCQGAALIVTTRVACDGVCLGRALNTIAQVFGKLVRPDGMAQLWLCNEVDRAGLKRLKYASTIRLPAADNDRHRRMFHRPAKHAEAIQLGHLEVQQKNVWLAFLNQADGFSAVAGNTYDLQLV